MYIRISQRLADLAANMNFLMGPCMAIAFAMCWSMGGGWLGGLLLFMFGGFLLAIPARLAMAVLMWLASVMFDWLERRYPMLRPHHLRPGRPMTPSRLP